MIIFVGRGVCVGEVYVYGEWVKVGKKVTLMEVMNVSRNIIMILCESIINY